jgi:hypothetical protein
MANQDQPEAVTIVGMGETTANLLAPTWKM